MLSKILDIFKNSCTYEKINKYSSIKMRHKENGIKLTDAIYYRFAYCNISSTKELITSEINFINKTKFKRQAYDAKEYNIPIKLYSNLLQDVKHLHNDLKDDNKDTMIKPISIDGVYNRDTDYKEVLNMGFFDINNELPIDLKPCG